VKVTGWLKGLRSTADGTGIVSHAGMALVRALADATGLTAGLSQALGSSGRLVLQRQFVMVQSAPVDVMRPPPDDPKVCGQQKIVRWRLGSA
jgi:hypothetical protein